MVRKSAFVAHGDDRKQAYHPETHSSCTIHAGTVVQQVKQAFQGARLCSRPVNLVPLNDKIALSV